MFTKKHVFKNLLIKLRSFKTKFYLFSEINAFPTQLSDFESHSQYHATIRSLDALYRDDLSCRGSTIGRIRNSVDPPQRFSRVRNTSLQLDGLTFDENRSFSPHQISRTRRKQMSWKGLNGDLLNGDGREFFAKIN